MGFLVFYRPRDWMGGINYLKSLFSCLHDYFPDRYRMTVYVPDLETFECFRDHPNVDCKILSALRRWSFLWILRNAIKTLFRRDLFLDFQARSDDLSFMSHTDPWGRKASVGFLPWIPDLQAVIMPHFFQARMLKRIYSNLDNVLQRGQLVLLSSYAAKEDLLKFRPGARDKLRVLHFSSRSNTAHGLLSFEEITSKYQIRGPFAYLPNQFWLHKNHRVVVEGLAILKQRGIDPIVVCTGHTNDHRNPGHFALLNKSVEELNLKGNFKVLGMLPYPEVQSLLQNAQLILNPSFFEGWATTVEEAKALNKRMLLSDIKVHREQAEGYDVDFFDPNSAVSFADAFEKVMNESQLPGLERAKIPYETARRRFAEEYNTIVEDMRRGG